MSKDKNRTVRMKDRWYRLDTAALIFPAIMRRNWSNAFRMSAEIKEDVDPIVLQRAVDDLQPRFPSFYVRLKKGFFWYYLQGIKEPIPVHEDYAYPLVHMNRRELKKSCLRIIYYRNRIAVEFFHSLTDGHGGSVFLSTLLSRYITLKYGRNIDPKGLIPDPLDKPNENELEDSFLKHSAEVPAGRAEESALHLKGTPLANGFLYITTGILSSDALVLKAHEYNCTVTAFLAAVMAESIIAMYSQRQDGSPRKPVKITIPVDLRRLFGSNTLRNFALTLNPGVNPGYGAYTLEELCRSFSHQLAADAVPQKMAGMIAANVLPQRNLLIRLCPVFIKNIVMDMVYLAGGEKNGCLNISNLGRLVLPEPMGEYVKRFDFVIGVQRSYPNNCSVISYNGKTCINMIRNIEESELERVFFSRLVDLGLAVEIESNRR